MAREGREASSSAGVGLASALVAGAWIGTKKAENSNYQLLLSYNYLAEKRLR